MPRRQVTLLAILVGFGLLLVGGMAILSELRDEPLSVLTKDPTAVKGLDFETGILTRIEVVVWVAAAAAALTAAFLARRLRRQEEPILFGFGLLGLVMAVDDSLTVHEAVSSVVGVPLIELGYVVALGWLLWRFRDRLLTSTPVLLLAGALIGMGLSEAVDLLDDHTALEAGAALEDIFKFLGIILYSGFLVLIAQAVIDSVGRESSASEPR
ncbi:MAG: hypothetical protein R2718_01445 [Solirubrobacterales bacterium]